MLISPSPDTTAIGHGIKSLKINERYKHRFTEYFLETIFTVSTAFHIHCLQLLMQRLISYQQEVISGLLTSIHQSFLPSAMIIIFLKYRCKSITPQLKAFPQQDGDLRIKSSFLFPASSAFLSPSITWHCAISNTPCVFLLQTMNTSFFGL